MADDLGKALSKLTKRANKAEQFAARRQTRGTSTTVIMKGNHTTKKPAVYHHSIEYNFLQYIRLVMRWGVQSSGLRKGLVELLLYLYPIGLFKKSDFHFFYHLVGLYGTKALDKLVEEGWIIVWRPAKTNQSALYVLSDKSKKLCSQMHKMCTGEEKIPESFAGKVPSKELVIDRYYTEVIKRMNKRKAPTEK